MTRKPVALHRTQDVLTWVFLMLGLAAVVSCGSESERSLEADLSADATPTSEAEDRLGNDRDPADDPATSIPDSTARTTIARESGEDEPDPMGPDLDALDSGCTMAAQPPPFLVDGSSPGDADVEMSGDVTLHTWGQRPPADDPIPAENNAVVQAVGTGVTARYEALLDIQRRHRIMAGPYEAGVIPIGDPPLGEISILVTDAQECERLYWVGPGLELDETLSFVRSWLENVANTGGHDAARTCEADSDQVCIVDVAAFENAVADALDRAAVLESSSGVELQAGSCSGGGDGPEQISWRLCELTLNDGRQIVIGRAIDDATTARTLNPAGEPVEFPLANEPGQATLLAFRSTTFVILDPDGVEIGTFAAP